MKKTLLILCVAAFLTPAFSAENEKSAFAKISAEKSAAAAIENLPQSMSLEEDQKLKKDLGELLKRLGKKKMTLSELQQLDSDFTSIMKKMSRYIAAISPEDTPLEEQIAADAGKFNGKSFERKYKKLNDEVNALLERNAPFSEYTPDQRSFVGAMLKINLTSTQGIAQTVKNALSQQTTKSPTPQLQKKP